ncbi:hypothetical protein FI667_g3553, partial [Globisporangium splendens]
MYQQQHARAAVSMTTAMAESEIEQFRAHQRMHFRQQQRFGVHGSNQTEADGHGDAALWDEEASDECDDRVRKMSTTKRRELRQQQLELEQQQEAQRQRQHCINSTLMLKLPNFGVPSRHEHQLFETAMMQMPSPVPHENHTMFNAFDYTSSPEAFSFAKQKQQHDDNNNNSSEDQFMQNDDDHENDDGKSLWRRRFACERRSPKLGQAALWESCDTGNNQFSHQHLAAAYTANCNYGQQQPFYQQQQYQQQ